jgi:hypothetical protein
MRRLPFAPRETRRPVVPAAPRRRLTAAPPRETRGLVPRLTRPRQTEVV